MSRYRNILIKSNIKQSPRQPLLQKKEEKKVVKINEDLWDHVFYNANRLEGKKYKQTLELLKILRRNGANVERKNHKIKITQGNIETDKWEKFKNAMTRAPAELKDSINCLFAISSIGQMINDKEVIEKLQKVFETKKKVFCEQQKQKNKHNIYQQSFDL